MKISENVYAPRVKLALILQHTLWVPEIEMPLSGALDKKRLLNVI